MVDTPKEDDDDGGKNPVEDKPSEAPPKHQRQRRRSKSRREKDSNSSTGDSNTPENAEDKEAPIEPTSEQGDGRTGKLTLMIKQGTETRRIATIYHSPRTR